MTQAPCQARGAPEVPDIARNRSRTRPARVTEASQMVSPAELFEADRPLLDEGVAALHGLLALVVEVERRVGELRHPGALLGVDVERLLRQGERRRALFEELPAPLLHLGAEVLLGHDLVDEPHRERLLRRVLAAEVPDLARALLADETGQVARAVPRVHAAHARARLAEDGVLRREREVAEHVEDVAAADREA